MTQTINDMLGANASLSAGTLTIQLTDFTDDSNTAYLASPTTATAHQAVAALLAHLHRVTLPPLDGNGSPIVDKTDAIVAVQSFTPKTFEVRDGEAQIRSDFNFYIYTQDASTFDPDDAVN